MQNEIPIRPEELPGMPGIPRHVIDWAFKRGERVCWLLLTPTGVNCCLRSGSLTLEFDTHGARESVVQGIRRATGRLDPLTDIPTDGPLTLENTP